MAQTTNSERLAELGVTGWHGVTWALCVVIGETPKRYRVRPCNTIGELRLAGRRTLRTGESALVPKRAIRFVVTKEN